MMVTNIEDLVWFMKGDKRSCQMFTQGVRNFWGHGFKLFFIYLFIIIIIIIIIMTFLFLFLVNMSK